MSDAPPRAIVDCNVFFQAFLTPNGPAFECVRLVEARKVRLVLSLELIAEARDVLSRPFVLQRFPYVTTAGIELFLESLSYVSELWREVPRIVQYARDPDDEPYLNLAIAAGARFVVTRDRDLLSLSTEHSAEAKQLRQLTQNRLQILTPVAFLNEFSSDEVSSP
jgi:putative PIN family toxin of toxin-antitoxin system